MVSYNRPVMSKFIAVELNLEIFSYTEITWHMIWFTVVLLSQPRGLKAILLKWGFTDILLWIITGVKELYNNFGDAKIYRRKEEAGVWIWWGRERRSTQQWESSGTQEYMNQTEQEPKPSTSTAAENRPTTNTSTGRLALLPTPTLPVYDLRVEI